jgi:hypothetical protein
MIHYCNMIIEFQREWVNAIGEFRNCLEQNMKKLKSQEN